jgi:hypothetical protein
VSAPAESFGCAQCWPESADAAWEAWTRLTTDATLIDELHFIVSLRACSGCKQRFVAVMTETVDWADGEDPQYRTLLPLTPDEAQALASRGSGVSESMLNGLGPGRRSLCADWPKGADKRIYWHKGIWVGQHD